MKNKTSTLKIGIGTPTILMIFVVLCMVILCVLSFMEANTNANMSEKEAIYTQNYYKAKTQAELIHNALISEKEISTINNQYQVEIKETDTELEYYVTIDEKKQLHVVIDRNDLFVIHMWNVETKGDN